MTEKPHSRAADSSELPPIEEKPFEPPSSGSTTSPNPVPLIDRPPFGGEDEES